MSDPELPNDEKMDDIIIRLNRLDSCAVSDAMDKLGLRGVVTGIHPYSTQRKIGGRVLTVKLGIDDGRSTAGKHLSTTAIEMAAPGDVIVVEQRTGMDAAAWGGNLSLGAKMRGVAGVICEGPAMATPLHVASSKGHAAVATALLEAGADVNPAGEDGTPTPLHLAAGEGH